MEQYRQECRDIIINIIREMAAEKGIAIDELSFDQLSAEIPPKPEYGDIAFPLFPFAKVFRDAPPKIAAAVEEKLSAHNQNTLIKKAQAAGPYINITLSRSAICNSVIESVNAQQENYGKNNHLENTKIMIEFSCPNTNKPLHLGHLRNDSLGESVGNILIKSGAEVLKVDLINDRGIHICKSMLAYQKFGNNTTPESEGIKSDHFVGDFYVKYAQWEKKEPEVIEQARKMLLDWEAGDEEVRKLWKTMNTWAIEGVKQTYKATGIEFDKYYYESETYELGREEILKGLEKGVFFKNDDGSIRVDLAAHDLDEKVLLRSDGTSLYLTQDIGTAISRSKDWPFERMIYVVASEQNYHFKVLFLVLEMLGYSWAKNLHHLSYGMVNLPEGKMKSREGTVVDADDLLSELTDYAAKEIENRERDDNAEDIKTISNAIALGALNYYLLSASPHKDIIFDPKQSISFTGDTGPYLQYTTARISSILRKFEERKDQFSNGKYNPELLTVQEEWDIIKMLSDFPALVAKAADELNPSVITACLFELAKLFSKYYHDNPVLNNEDPNLVITRIELLKAILPVLKSGFNLVGIPFLERM